VASEAFNLDRFVDAQAPIYHEVVSELRAAHKRTHWMWFIFPQLKGLGFSPTAVFFGVGGADEAAAYLAHPILGPRLRECAALVNEAKPKSLLNIFGSPDDMKFQSSMTLFAAIDPDVHGEFRRALGIWCPSGDPHTLSLLGNLPSVR
jgi:uncharacterized protein (DUF1810 family)